MLHKQTPTARMFVNADEFIKKKYTRQHEIGSYEAISTIARERLSRLVT